MKTKKNIFQSWLSLSWLVCLHLCLVSSLATAAVSSNTWPELSNSFTLPARLEENYFILQVEIGEEGPFQLLLDTGSDVTIITREVATRLQARGKLHDAPDVKGKGVSGKTIKLNGVELRDLRLGDYRVPRLHAVVTDLKALNRAMNTPVDGLAGLNLFRNVRLDLDYPAGQVLVAALDAPPPSGAQPFPSLPKNGIPTVTFQVAGQNYQAMLDSGASDGFYFGAAKSLPLAGRPIEVGHAVSLGVQSKFKSARLATNIMLGGLQFERPIVCVDEKVPRIGGEVLQHFRLGLNQRHAWIYFTPGTNGPVTKAGLRSLGLSLAPHERGLEVMGVVPSTDAARAQIRAGDIITQFNGEPATQWTRARRRALVREADIVEVEFVRGSQIRKLKLKVAVLVE